MRENKAKLTPMAPMALQGIPQETTFGLRRRKMTVNVQEARHLDGYRVTSKAHPRLRRYGSVTRIA